jgi:methyl-accepting chemotaxis protein
MRLSLQQDAASSQQLKEQIRQTVKDAQQAAEQASRAAADAKASGGEAIRVAPGPFVVGPGVTVMPSNRDFPPQAAPVAISFFVMMGFIIVGLPLARAIARRIDRSTQRPQQVAPEIRQQLDQLSASVEAIAIEVERISEGQRFTTRLLTGKEPALPGQESRRSTP